MTPARWTSILLAACAGVLGPMLAMTTVSSCGSNSSSDNGSGSDATTDGPNTGDGSHQGDGRGGIGDAGSGDHDLGNWDACSGSCPPTVLCGHYTNPCTGAVLACGTYCNAGQVCVNQGGSPPSASCQPLATQCADKCGFYGNDNCGVPIYCGGCEGGLACIHNSCLPQQVSDAAPPDASGGPCGPLTCTPNSGVTLCGTIADGCGHTLACPTCPNGQQCGPNGVCGALPPECEATDAHAPLCGPYINACGTGEVACPGCTGNTVCQNSTCQACTPPSCGGKTCGSVSNGCGPAVSCGQCGSGELCYDGGCCTPLSCDQAAEAGVYTGCAEVDLGCGQHASCSTCGSGEKCYDGGCCTPLTCDQAIEAGIASTCGPVDLGCGVSQSCGKCGSNETCYDGGCCTPLTCADAVDAGLVTGCGAVDLGCGEQKSCQPCTGTQVCQNNTCVNCTPKTCADFPSNTCDIDPCSGASLTCCLPSWSCQTDQTGGSSTICCPPTQVNQKGICCPQGQINANGICCPQGEINTSGICCLPGQVDYGGTCCTPQCNSSLPPGPQNVCGITIYCNGTQ